jgi:two-component system sensor histidine kinase VicK
MKKVGKSADKKAKSKLLPRLRSRRSNDQPVNFTAVNAHELAQSHQLLTIINNISDAILSINPRGTINLYNAAALSLLDTNVGLNGASIDQVFKITNEDGDELSLLKLAQEAPRTITRTDLLLVYPDGQKANLYMSISPVRGAFLEGTDNKEGMIIIARDITKQKSLDDERDEFISVVSHELRTPVTIAEGALSNLQVMVERGADTSTFSAMLDPAHDKIVYLEQMVNDLSTLSRAQRGVYMDPEDINIQEFMQALYTKYLPSAQEKKLVLNFDVHIQGVVSVARMAIEEIMQNLITNAIKYTASGSVTIGVKEDDDGQVEFYVRDTGIGISTSDAKNVFRRFWRSEDYRTRETDGSGLGLHVTNQLAEKIGTTMKLTSRLNHGSSFSFCLPLKK